MKWVQAVLVVAVAGMTGCRAQGSAPAAPQAGLPPQAINDIVLVETNSANNSIQALANDIDRSGTGLVITGVVVDQVLPPAAGAVAATDGSRVTFTPPPGFIGVVTLLYGIRDGTGAVSTALIAVSVLPVALPPVALPDTATVAQDSGPTDVDVLANDVDFAGGGLTVTSATVAASLPPAAHTVTIAGNQVRFTPAAGFVGVAVVGYTATDVNGAGTDGVLSVVVSPVAVPAGPVPVPDAVTVAQDSGATLVDVLANDVDPAGGGLTVTGVAVTASLPAAVHAVAISGNQVQFTPAAGFAGTVVVGYTATDAGGNSADGVLSVVVSPVALPVGLVAIPDAAIVPQDSAPTDIDVLANDVDFAGGGLTLAAVSVTSSLPAAVHTVAIAGGRVRFTPAPAFAGVVVITYTAMDVDGLTSNGLLNIVVTPAPLVLGPVAVPDVAVVSSAAGPVSIDVLANDVDPAAGGLTLTLAAIETEIPAGAGSVAIVGNQVRYTPAPLYTGAVLVRYTATDINGNTTQGQLSLTVTL
jgi:hypothetical protein